MKIKLFTFIVINLFLVSCGGGGGGPSAPTITPPAITTGGGTVTANPATVPAAGNFDVTITTDIANPMLQVQLVLTFIPALITTLPTVSVGTVFDIVAEASFLNDNPASGILYIWLRNNNPTIPSSSTGDLCTITFTNNAVLTPPATASASISFAGSILELESNPLSFPSFSVDPDPLTVTLQ